MIAGAVLSTTLVVAGDEAQLPLPGVPASVVPQAALKTYLVLIL